MITSLPALAAALREAGFTLAGGGVSPRSGGDPGGGHAGASGDGAAGRPHAEARPGSAALPAGVRPIRAGGVDLYA